jgi:hypothetical protein
MKKLIIYISLLVTTSFVGYAQRNTENRVPKVTKVTSVAKMEVNMESDNLDFIPLLTHQMPEPGEEEDKEVEKMQIEKTKIKLQHLGMPSTEIEKVTRAITPLYDTGWKANSSSGTPPDNSIAVNTKGQIVSMVNSNIIIYSSKGQILYSKTLPSFFNLGLIPGQPTGTSGNQCDPKVIFDCEKRRFIAFSQTCDGSSGPNRILIAYSKAEDPLLGWNAYVYDTDPNNLGVWFDYPRIGVNANDLFVAGNMFDIGGGFNQGHIFQFDKIAGYAGNANVDGVVHSNIPGFDFSMTSANPALCGAYSQEHYLVSSSSGGSNKLSLYTINGKANAINPPTLSHQSVNLALSYSAVAYGVQKGTATLLKSGDARMQDAYINNGMIHCAFHADMTGGYAGIFYTRLTKNGSTWSATSKRFTTSNTEMAYPRLTNFDNNSAGGTSQNTLMTYLTSSTSEYPGMKAVVIDDAFLAGTPILVKEGTGYVDYLSDINTLGQSTTRWGDYSGAWRQHYNIVPTVWVSGMYGNSASSAKAWSNHIAKLTNGKDPKWAVGIDDVAVSNSSSSVYPNPSSNDEFTMSINASAEEKVTISIVDALGKSTKNLLTGKVFAGNNTFTCRTNTLANGIYFVKVIGDKNLNLTQRLVIQN